MVNKLAINGRIFEYPITGVGRFCYEVISELDKMVEKESCILLVSRCAKNIPKLQNISVVVIGKSNGIFWEQVELPVYLYRHKLYCLSMSSSVPILKPDAVLIHDISLKVNKKFCNGIKERIKIFWPRIQYWVAVKFADKLFTDSEFQKKEIEREYKTKREIYVVFCGWQHMYSIEESNAVDKYNLKKYDYYFAVATRAKNKNFKWIIEASKYNKDSTFVIAGKLDSKFFADSVKLDEQCNIITLGYVDDSEMKNLMHYCKAFIYPSLYEGFGIPPLEALSVGAKAIVAKSSCLPEIYEDTVYYIDPENARVKLNELLNRKIESANVVLNKYSWKKTTYKIKSSIY